MTRGEFLWEAENLRRQEKYFHRRRPHLHEALHVQTSPAILDWREGESSAER